MGSARFVRTIDEGGAGAVLLENFGVGEEEAATELEF